MNDPYERKRADALRWLGRRYLLAMPIGRPAASPPLPVAEVDRVEYAPTQASVEVDVIDFWNAPRVPSRRLRLVKG